jgi:hypothetical protein
VKFVDEIISNIKTQLCHPNLVHCYLWILDKISKEGYNGDIIADLIANKHFQGLRASSKVS